MHCAIQKAEVLDGAHLMQILWQDGTESFYPAVWLRDNCQCPSCYLDSAKARKFLVESLDVNIGIKDLSFDRKRVLITWPSEHYSEFEADWLKKRCFSQQAREKLQRELFFPGEPFKIWRQDADHFPLIFPWHWMWNSKLKRQMIICQKRLLSWDRHSWEEDVDNNHSLTMSSPVAHRLGTYFVLEAL